jgi:hypothetical protein
MSKTEKNENTESKHHKGTYVLDLPIKIRFKKIN